MPKYVLGTDGNIIDLEKSISDSDRKIEEVASEYAKKGGSYHNKQQDLFNTSDVDLPTFSKGDLEEHATRVVKAPTLEGDGLFPAKSFGSDHNSSFGADAGFTKYKNFNNYLTNKEIFASELEIIGTGIDLNSFPGFKDLTKFTLAFELIIEAIAYITIIEAALQAERSSDENKRKNKKFPKVFELGNYGPISLTSITRYFNDILNYPINKMSRQTTGLINILSDASDRIGAFFVGFMLYINADPLVLYKNLGNDFPVISESRNALLNVGSFDAVSNAALMLLEALLTLNNLESNRLHLLVRRFNQKTDWHLNRLFKAKEDTVFKDNALEKFLVEFNYYYVKFIIERMNIGLNFKKYYRDLNKKENKLNRSGRLKDSYASNGLYQLSYNGDADKKLKIKSFKGKEYQMNQSMSSAFLPQAFVLPKSFISSYYNSTKRVLDNYANEFVSTYFLKTEKHQERLSNDVVKKLEAHYEKEMMPFYFQDLRTNEIIGFHAFIESITDNFNPNYTQTKGFGRIDDVRHYVDTTRNVNITFALAAMSKEDHDLMWYQINKIVSMVYPQWSRGFEASSADDPNSDGFEYPFTQVPTASPLIRIRLGDIIKSNYTQHAIEKIHGSGNKQKKVGEDDIPKKKYFEVKQGEYDLLVPRSEPGEPKTTLRTDVEVEIFPYLDKGVAPYADKLTFEQFSNSSYGDIFVVKPTNSSFAFSYAGAISDSDFFVVKKEDIVVKEAGVDQKKLEELKLNLKKEQRKNFKNYTSSRIDDKLNNPIAAAYETTLGKGLAGFITMLDVNYQDQLWETEVNGSKAPKLVKIGVNFAPLHDIPPGLDADGAMRAPVYNTGKIINTFYGDVYDKDN